jgi:hypothetical protein
MEKKAWLLGTTESENLLLNPLSRGCCLCIRGGECSSKTRIRNLRSADDACQEKSHSAQSIISRRPATSLGRHGSLAWQNGGQPDLCDLFALRVEEDRADQVPIPSGCKLFRLRSVCHLFPGWSVGWAVRSRVIPAEGFYHMRGSATTYLLTGPTGFCPRTDGHRSEIREIPFVPEKSPKRVRNPNGNFAGAKAPLSSGPLRHD